MFNYKFIISSFLLIIGYNCILADSVQCPEICPALYAPVCASDGKIYKEFSNLCELSASNCRLERSNLKPYSEVEKDWCSTTFVENLREKLNNLDLTKPECLKPCPMIYSPVCVSNGKYRATLSNECEMGLYNCALGLEDVSKHFKVLKPSEC